MGEPLSFLVLIASPGIRKRVGEKEKNKKGRCLINSC